jgi:hypothetical protein
MENRRGLLILAIPLIAGLALAGILLLRSGADSSLPVRHEQASEPASVPATEPVRPSASRPKPKPASEEKIAQATDEARVRATYQNFRTAVANRNSAIQDALRPIILRDRDFAVRLAQQEMSTAQSEVDRDIARMTLEALRR